MSRWTKILGLCFLLVGLVWGLNAGLVHAEEGSEWFYEGKELKTFKELKPEIKASLAPPNDAALLMEFGNNTVRLLCTMLGVQNARFGPGGLILDGARILGQGCRTFTGRLNGNKEVIEEKESVACVPISGSEKGVVESAKLKGSLALHEGTTTAIIEPESSETLATIKFGEECALGEKISLFGKLHLKDSESEATVEKIKHTVQEGPLTEMHTTQKTENQVARVDGNVVIELAGADAGKKWSGKAG